uniref:Uncharacterized protein n=1 Tax=Chromulina nebulosa TaxID=96789 RepID=A0A7S0XDC9_9STRA|mmetsp:Transcript_3254/g.2897  ORF Transcript_3254/g.2897 Transcript_3254/m.2897 type:complete len:225 (+) Transcript_3254:28-702(+)
MPSSDEVTITLLNSNTSTTRTLINDDIPRKFKFYHSIIFTLTALFYLFGSIRSLKIGNAYANAGALSITAALLYFWASILDWWKKGRNITNGFIYLLPVFASIPFVTANVILTFPDGYVNSSGINFAATCLVIGSLFMITASVGKLVKQNGIFDSNFYYYTEIFLIVTGVCYFVDGILTYAPLAEIPIYNKSAMIWYLIGSLSFVIAAILLDIRYCSSSEYVMI